MEIKYNYDEKKGWGYVSLPDGFELAVVGNEESLEGVSNGIILRFPKEKFWEKWKEQIEEGADKISVAFTEQEITGILEGVKMIEREQENTNEVQKEKSEENNKQEEKEDKND